MSHYATEHEHRGWHRWWLVMVALLTVAGVWGPAHRAGAVAPGSYRFLAMTPYGPMRWAPDRPVRYLLNLNGRAADRAVVEQALSIVAAGTGIPFQYVGDTTFLPSYASPLPPEVWSRMDRNAPYDVVIAIGGPSLMAGPGHPGMTLQQFTGAEYLHGAISVDVSAVTPGWGPGSLGVVLLHETAHLMGLAHVPDPNSVLFPTRSNVTFFGPVEWEGLNRLGYGQGRPYDPALSPTPIAGPAPAATVAPPAAPNASPTPLPPVTMPVVTPPVTAGPSPAPAPSATNATLPPAPPAQPVVPAAPAASAGTHDDPMEALLARAY